MAYFSAEYHRGLQRTEVYMDSDRRDEATLQLVTYDMGEKMRIGLFSWESLYSIKVGGVAPHVSELSEALAREGHEMHVFTRRGDFDQYDCINEVTTKG